MPLPILAAAGVAGKIFKGIFKGIRAKIQKKKAEKRVVKAAKKQAEANDILASTGLNKILPPLDDVQQTVFKGSEDKHEESRGDIEKAGTFDKIMLWIKDNVALSIGIGVGIAGILFFIFKRKRR